MSAHVLKSGKSLPQRGKPHPNTQGAAAHVRFGALEAAKNGNVDRRQKNIGGIRNTLILGLARHSIL